MEFVWLFALFAVSVACPQGKSDDYNLNSIAKNRNIKDNSNNPCWTPKDVAQFNKYFADEVKNCQQLTNVFNVAKNITREEIKSALFFINIAIAEPFSKGYAKPVADTLISIENISNNCEKISPNLLLSIYSNSIGKILYNAKKLDGPSAQIQAKTFASNIKEVADWIAGEYCPRSNFQSIIEGCAGFIIGQGVYANNTGNISRIYSNEWKCQDKSAFSQKKCLIACYSPEKPALKECDNVCNIKDKAIDKFVNAFSQKVKSSENLTSLFNVEPSVSPAVYSRGIYFLALHYNYKLLAENPRGLADFQSRYIQDVKDLKPSVVERVHSQFMGKYLLSEKVLTCKNADILGEMLAGVMENKAKMFVDETFKISNIFAIEASWRAFLQSIDLLSVDKASKLSYLYGNEWRCQA